MYDGAPKHRRAADHVWQELQAARAARLAHLRAAIQKFITRRQLANTVGTELEAKLHEEISRQKLVQHAAEGQRRHHRAYWKRERTRLVRDDEILLAAQLLYLEGLQRRRTLTNDEAFARALSLQISDLKPPQRRAARLRAEYLAQQSAERAGELSLRERIEPLAESLYQIIEGVAGACRYSPLAHRTIQATMALSGMPLSDVTIRNVLKRTKKPQSAT